MRRRLSVALRILAVATLTLTIVITASGPAYAADPDVAGESGSLAGAGSARRPGDVVVDHGISLIVPAAGQSVWAAAEFADGSVQELHIETSHRGEVRLTGWGDDTHVSPGYRPVGTLASGSEISALSDGRARGGECRYDARRFFGWRTPVYRWHYSHRTTPRKFTRRPNGRQAVVAAIKRANRSITEAVNVCGRRDRVGARFVYKGLTRRPPLGRGTSCGRADGISAIGWGYLPNRAIAYMCVLSGRGRGLEADIKISNTQPYETSMKRCRGEFLIEAAMTHEFGHVYGLGHVGPHSLTMHPDVAWCSRAQRTLGLGDMIGLERKY